MKIFPLSFISYYNAAEEKEKIVISTQVPYYLLTLQTK